MSYRDYVGLIFPYPPPRTSKFMEIPFKTADANLETPSSKT